MNIRRNWPLLLASVPLWSIIWLFVFASVVAIKVGHWPGYGYPDTGTWSWPWQVLDITALALLLAAPLSILATVAAVIHSWLTCRWDWRVFLVLPSFALFVAWLRFDPLRVIEWWVD